MSKRSRGPARPTAHRRPGSRPAATRPARTRPIAPSQLEAAAVIAEDVIDDRPAEAARELDRATRATYQRQRGVKAGSLLAAKAATEYVYVAQDMRRILLVAAVLFGVLIVGWVLIVLMRVVPLPFY
jgi:hypothetical protein